MVEKSTKCIPFAIDLGISYTIKPLCLNETGTFEPKSITGNHFTCKNMTS